MKPNWDDAPEWATWMAQDKDGYWLWYEFKPYKGNEEWFKNKNNSGRVSIAYPSFEGWDNTLEMRP